MSSPRRRESERGASALEYTGLIVVAALVLGALAALGFPGPGAERTEDAVCVIVHGDACAGPREAGSVPERDGGGARPGVDGGCRGFWGCTWSAVSGFGRGAGDAAKDGVVDSVLLVKNLIVHPVDTSEGIASYLWSKSAGGLVTGCTTSAAECAKATACVLSGPNCLIHDMVFDEETRAELRAGHWSPALGRFTVNAGSLVLPTKIPRLKGIRPAGTFDDAVRSGRSPGDLAEARAYLENEILKAPAKNGKKTVPADRLEHLVSLYERLAPAEKTALLRGNVKADLLAHATPASSGG